MYCYCMILCISSDQWFSCVRMPGFSVDYQLLEFAETHVHWVDDSIQPSHSVVPFYSPYLMYTFLFSSYWKWKWKRSSLNLVWLCESMDCSLPGSSVHGILQARYWSGLPFPPPGVPLHLGIEPGSPALQEDSLLSEPPGENPISSIKFLLFWLWLWYSFCLRVPPIFYLKLNPSSGPTIQIYFFRELNFFIVYLLILDLLGVHCCAGAFSTWGKWGLFFEGHRLLIKVVSLVVEHRLKAHSCAHSVGQLL